MKSYFSASSTASRLDSRVVPMVTIYSTPGLAGALDHVFAVVVELAHLQMRVGIDKH